MTWEPDTRRVNRVYLWRKIIRPFILTPYPMQMELAAADDYLDSRKLNLDCKNAIEEAIKENFDGMHLAQGTAEKVLEAYGAERISFVLGKHDTEAFL